MTTILIKPNTTPNTAMLGITEDSNGYGTGRAT